MHIWLRIGVAALAGRVLGYLVRDRLEGAPRSREAQRAPAALGVARAAERVESTPPQSPSSADPALALLAADLEAVRALVEHLATVPPDSPVPAAQRVAVEGPARTDGDALEELGATLDEILERMERLEGQILLAGASRRQNAPLRLPARGVRPRPLPAMPTEPDDAAEERFARSHDLWTYQDLLDQYGLPDDIHLDDGQIEWEYRYPGGEDDVHFILRDGLCTGLFAH